MRSEKNDPRVQMKDQIGAYTDLFDKQSAEDRKGDYAGVVNKYYDLATDFYEFGWGASFHFAPRHKWETHDSSIIRHELWLASKLRLSEGQKAMDVGCGVGGPLRNIAKFSGAKIMGLNNNEYQVTRAKRIAAQSGLEGQATYLKGDFMNIPIPEGTFDAAYSIEATCHAPDRVGVYSQIFKTLKPGGLFGSYEWVLTETYDAQNETHRALKLGIERGNGLPELEPASVIVQALKDAGFEVIEHHDRIPTSDIPWYFPLTPRLSPTGIFHTWLGRYVALKGLGLMEKLKVVPAGSTETLDMLQKGGNALVDAGEAEIFTPMYWVLARKPE